MTAACSGCCRAAKRNNEWIAASRALPPASAVCAWAREHQPDLLVAGAHRGHLKRVALGSFASYLAYHAPSAVLLVRPVES